MNDAITDILAIAVSLVISVPTVRPSRKDCTPNAVVPRYLIIELENQLIKAGIDVPKARKIFNKRRHIQSNPESPHESR